MLAFILKKTTKNEDDAIVTLLTEDLGKITAYAYKVSNNKNLPNALQPLTLYNLHLNIQNNKLPIINTAAIEYSYKHITSNLLNLSIASTALENIELTLPEAIPANTLFQATSEFIEILNQLSNPELPQLPEEASLFALRYFEIRLISHLGLLPHLESCTSCFAPLKNAAFNPQSSILCPNCCPTPQIHLSDENRRATLKCLQQSLPTLLRNALIKIDQNPDPIRSFIAETTPIFRIILTENAHPSQIKAYHLLSSLSPLEKQNQPH